MYITHPSKEEVEKTMVNIARVLGLKKTLETIEKVDGKEEAEKYLKEIRETDKELYDEYILLEEINNQE